MTLGVTRHMVFQTTPEDIDSTLKERGTKYGEYTRQADIAQNFKNGMRNTPSWDKLEPFQKEALDMVANKLGRILNGDPNYIDSWHDIIGYVKLVENELVRREQADHKGSIRDSEGPLRLKDMDADALRDGVIRRRATVEEVAAGDPPKKGGAMENIEGGEIAKSATKAWDPCGHDSPGQDYG